MGTLTELQQKQIEKELLIQQQNRLKAARVLERHAKRKRWKKGEAQQVREMLGLDLPPSVLHSGNVSAFNNS